MAGKIIGFIVALGCGIMFYYIGVYAKKLDTPMWFWSGTKVDASKITDVKKYNRANSMPDRNGTNQFWNGQKTCLQR